MGRDPRLTTVLNLIAREHALLDAGAYDALFDVVSERVALIEQLADAPPGKDDLSALQAAVAGISDRLEAARAGVARARRRVAALDGAQFSTYTRDSVVEHRQSTPRTHRMV
ncbi:putative membrane protein affecting hemolysin expression [Rubricella aquisinus]|uniref:Putative membrane protein affecting hemolysin expression n=1 Tax=Rubricella aquisinus TaxID=2028108 RepID=A0A840WNJ1_9RHOB|nr:hypothetical protein [Rubricella aquisinus]MBB5515222.1 putative membrane protein affecting hemolysin expression [Rubricella aquisinus]